MTDHGTDEAGLERDGNGHDHDHDDMLDRATAVERVLALRAAALDDRTTRTVDIDAIAGRTLTEPIVAESDRPAADHATMDGFAFDATEDYPLEVVDVEVFPEDDPPAIDDGQAVKIATGAPLPERANAVLKVEEGVVEDGYLRGTNLAPGTYVYERGSNVAAGERLFEVGERLAPRDAIFLRDLGIESVAVHERFRAGVLATGTEIHEGRQSDLDSPMLAGLVRSWGHESTYEGSVPDEYDRVVDRIADLAAAYDVVITTGGTSVGKKDYVIRALADLGRVDFHRVTVRPGKPIAAAELPDYGATAFAIPGKPVGAHTISTLVMGPFFTGRRPGDGELASIPAEFARDVEIGAPGFEYAVPVTLDADHGGGVPNAMPVGHVDSPLGVYEDTFDPSVLSSSSRATRADGFVITESALSAGERVCVHPYPVVEQ
jgi:molybdopterin molybdotransferase